MPSAALAVPVAGRLRFRLSDDGTRYRDALQFSFSKNRPAPVRSQGLFGFRSLPASLSVPHSEGVVAVGGGFIFLSRFRTQAIALHQFGYTVPTGRLTFLLKPPGDSG